MKQETRIIRQLRGRPVTGPLTSNFVLPNNSGDHAKGIKLNDPNLEVDLVNKKYVDDNTHTQNTDTALGSGCVAQDHGTASTDMVINVCYGTGEPPAANTTTIGSLFVKYTE